MLSVTKYASKIDRLTYRMSGKVSVDRSRRRCRRSVESWLMLDMSLLVEH